jgi:hypothetical protein
MYVFITHSVIAETRDTVFSADDGGVSVAQVDGKRVRRYVVLG